MKHSELPSNEIDNPAQIDAPASEAVSSVSPILVRYTAEHDISSVTGISFTPKQQIFKINLTENINYLCS